MPLQEVHTGFTFQFDGSKLAAVQRGVKRASTGLNTIAARTEAFTQRMGGFMSQARGVMGAYLGFRAIKVFTSDYAQAGDEIAKFSAGLGISSQEYQRLTHAAQLNGVTIAELNVALPKLAKSAGDAADGSKALRDAFSRAGIGFQAGKALGDPIKLMSAFADGLKNVKDPIRRTQILMNAFGRSGKKMGVLMAQGSVGIKKAMQEADKLGLVMSQKQLKASEQYMDAMLRLKGILTGVRNIIAARLLPAITRNIEAFRRWWTEGRNAERALRALKLVAIFTGIVIARMFGAAVMRNVKLFVQGIWAGVQALRAMGLAGAAAAIKVWAIIAGFAIIALAIEDLIGFAQGKDSVIGRLLGDTSLAKNLKDALLDVGKAAVAAWKDLKPALLDAWSALKPALAGIGEAMKPIAGDVFRAAIWMLVASLRGLAGIIRTATVLVSDMATAAAWAFGLFSSAVEKVKIALEDVSDVLSNAFPKSAGLAGAAWKGAMGIMSATVATLAAGMKHALALKDRLFGVTVSGSISKARKQIAGALKGGGSFQYDPSVGAPVTTGGPSLGPNIFSQPGAPHRRMPIGFGAGTDINGNRVTTNVGAGAVNVTVNAKGNAKAIAAEVNAQVNKGINRAFTSASRDLVKAPQGQR